MLNEVEYRSYVTAYPPGVVYTVVNRNTGEDFDFSGEADGSLLFTIASLSHALRPDGTLPDETERHYLGLAAYQMKVADGALVQWVCQRPEDAVALRAVLQKYAEGLRDTVPFGVIQVRELVPESDAE